METQAIIIGNNSTEAKEHPASKNLGDNTVHKLSCQSKCAFAAFIVGDVAVLVIVALGLLNKFGPLGSTSFIGAMAGAGGFFVLFTIGIAFCAIKACKKLPSENENSSPEKVDLKLNNAQSVEPLTPQNTVSVLKSAQNISLGKTEDTGFIPYEFSKKTELKDVDYIELNNGGDLVTYASYREFRPNYETSVPESAIIYLRSSEGSPKSEIVFPNKKIRSAAVEGKTYAIHTSDNQVFVYEGTTDNVVINFETTDSVKFAIKDDFVVFVFQNSDFFNNKFATRLAIWSLKEKKELFTQNYQDCILANMSLVADTVACQYYDTVKKKTFIESYSISKCSLIGTFYESEIKGKMISCFKDNKTTIYTLEGAEIGVFPGFLRPFARFQDLLVSVLGKEAYEGSHFEIWSIKDKKCLQSFQFERYNTVSGAKVDDKNLIIYGLEPGWNESSGVPKIWKFERK